jgi:DinB family protein
VRCDECGYDYNEPARSDVAPRIRAFGPRFAALLDRAGPDVRTKPAPDVWSPLEYGCHVRDMFRAQRARIALALEQDTPFFTSIRRDERAVEERYNEQDAGAVGNEIEAATDELADALEALDDTGWARTGVYTYPTEEVRTLEWVARHTVHEGVHHLMDIERQLR